MAPIILAALLTQFVPAASNQEIGALNALYSTAVDVVAGTRTIVTNAAKTRSCIRFAGNAAAPTGSVTVRAGVIVMSANVQYRAGLAIPADVPTVDPVDGHTLTVLERWTLTGERYGVLEIQAVPSDTPSFDLARLNEHFDVIRNEVELRASPVNATCEVGIARQDDATFGSDARCACAKTTACKLADNLTAAPLGVTLGPGGFTASTACQAKPCVTRFDGAGVDKTWPAVCPR